LVGALFSCALHTVRVHMHRFLCSDHDLKSLNERPAIFSPRGTFRARCGTFRAMRHLLGRASVFLTRRQLF
jgi:hypothetical protein